MHGHEQVAGVILAAGASTRFGSPKPLARVGSRTMLQVAVDAATGAGLEPILAVVPPGVPVPPAVEAVTNEAPERGMSHSLQLGLGAVPAAAEAALVLLVDQPTVDVQLLERVLGARGLTPVVATRAGGITGPPVLLERDAFALAGRSSGDVGLRDLLRGEPALVTPLDLDDPIPDVDEPRDLEGITEPCPGCGARFLPQVVDEAHPHIGASPACWSAFGEVLAREPGDVAFGRVHRQTVDVYAVQHPGTDGRRQRQSVAVHLVALCGWLEHGLETDRLNAITQRLASEDRAWPWLTTPEEYRMTVIDVLVARDGDEHVPLVRRWAETTWEAWAAHHDVVRGWAREALP